MRITGPDCIVTLALTGENRAATSTTNCRRKE